MMTFGKFTYPFRYSPAPEVKEAASRVMAHIDASPRLREIFSEGKMLGVLTVAVDNTVSGKAPAFRQSDNSNDTWPDGQGSKLAGRQEQHHDCVDRELPYRLTDDELPHKLPDGNLLQHDDALPRKLPDGNLMHRLTAEGESHRLPDAGLLHKLPDGTAYLVAFSGNVGGANLIDGFVPPVFDLLDPEGHFKAEEKRITEINREISLLSERRISPDAYHGNGVTVAGNSIINDDAAAESPGTGSGADKERRNDIDAPASSGNSQVYRTGREDNRNGIEERVHRLKEERKRMSDNLQKWIFSRYVVRNGKGEERNILDIFADHGLVPPGGTGDCAAPKLLQYAFTHGLRPLAMGEFWYPGGEFRPSCSSKCGPLLRWMLKGVDVDNPYEFDNDTVPEILWEDDSLMVVNKPAGMLCTPGKDGQTSLIERLPQPAYSVHRLDMDTSGVLIVARTLRAQATLQRQFEERKVGKTYVALVENRAGLHPGDTGTVSLPLRPDIDDRPRQIVDFEHGREAVTDYTVLDILTPDGKPDNVPAGNAGDPSRFTGPFPFREPMSPASPTGTDTGSSSYRTPDKKDCKAKPDNGTGPDSRPELALMEFRPFTGRTHQLRVHAATGLGCPIFGDLLYGGGWHRRMCLHAARISFDHPLTGERLTFTVRTGSRITASR